VQASGTAARSGPAALDEGIPILEALLERLAALHRAEQPFGALGPDAVTVGPWPDGEPEVALAQPEAGPDPRFLAPECRGGTPTAEGDVWSAGTYAFWLFAGRPPREDGAFEPLAMAAPGVPFRLGALVDRMRALQAPVRPRAAAAAQAVRALRESAGLGVPEEKPEAPAGDAAEPKARGWLGGLIKRKGGPPPKTADAPARPRAATLPSLALLCLDDLEPIPRVEGKPPPQEALLEAFAATLAEGARSEDLPAFPSVALEVVELAKREDVGANDLVRLINQDPALIARVLRIANSVYANRGIEVTSARDAVTRLGLNEVANIAATAATRTLFVLEGGRMDPTLAQEGRRAWVHALTTALSASWLAMECGADSQRAFLAGMLHDIGKMVALRGFARLVAAGRLPGVDPAAAVGPVLEAAHVELGTRMARAWSLPAAVIRACAEHHRAKTPPMEDRELHLVRIVSGLASLRIDPAWNPERILEIQESATLLGFDRFRIRASAAQVRLLAGRAEALAQAAD
jgi:putative nucleotidyltransferase with HDIG domain